MHAELIDGMVQSLFAPAFPLEFFSMQQFDRVPATQSKQLFDDGAVHHPHLERFPRNLLRLDGFRSEVGRGTAVSLLLPRARESGTSDEPGVISLPSDASA